MRKQYLLPMLMLGALGVTLPAQAADGWYLGLTGGLMDNDRGGFDDALNGGVILGYEFTSVGIGDLAVEGLYTTTLDEGDAPRGRDWELGTWGAYGVFRSAGPIYIKAKGGVLHTDFEVGSASNDDTEFSAGLGVGFTLGVGQLEFEYTRVDDDIDFLSVALQLKTPF